MTSKPGQCYTRATVSRSVTRRPRTRAARACRHVREAVRFELQPIHRDDAHAGECVIVELAERALHQLASGEALAVDGSP